MKIRNKMQANSQRACGIPHFCFHGSFELFAANIESIPAKFMFLIASRFPIGKIERCKCEINLFIIFSFHSRLQIIILIGI